MRARLAASELDAWRQRTPPHFLFNALNAIGALVRLRRNDQAVRALASLADLQRFVLESAEAPFVPLARELACVGHYLELERIRFGERMQVTIRAEPGVDSLLVPSLLLQPLVENAVKHGVARRTGPSRVAVLIARCGGDLGVVVRNDPPDAAVPAAAGTGFGLRAVGQRLAGLYGDRARFAFVPDHPEGVTVTLALPLAAA